MREYATKIDKNDKFWWNCESQLWRLRCVEWPMRYGGGCNPGSYWVYLKKEVTEPVFLLWLNDAINSWTFFFCFFCRISMIKRKSHPTSVHYKVIITVFIDVLCSFLYSSAIADKVNSLLGPIFFNKFEKFQN